MHIISKWIPLRMRNTYDTCTSILQGPVPQKDFSAKIDLRLANDNEWEIRST